MSRDDLAPNVISFLQQAAAKYGRLRADRFESDLACQCLERGLESPIEDLFLIAVNLISASNYVDVDPDPYMDSTGQWQSGYGLHIRPQALIGKYRVDFALDLKLVIQTLAPVIVELDGHAFHDKDKKQRAYEKARDRYLVAQGYRVLHFTGSEVVDDPFKVADEALRLLGVIENGDYNPEDPTGMGY